MLGDHEAIFQVVKNGRDAAIRFVPQSYPGKMLAGRQVEAARQSITQAGYGEWFLLRIGNSIHDEDHGNGAILITLKLRAIAA